MLDARAERGATSQGKSTWGPWWREKQKTYTNILELKVVQLAILTFTKFKEVQRKHLQMDNMVVLIYPIRMRGPTTRSLWIYQRKYGSVCSPNVQYGLESRNFHDKSGWKLSPVFFHKICQKLSTPSIDLFASQIIHQLSVYTAWKPDPRSWATNAMQKSCARLFPYAFPPFCLIPEALSKLLKAKITMILVTPTSQTQAWYTVVPRVPPIFTATSKGSFFGSIRKSSPTSIESYTKSGGLAGFRKSLATRYISKKATKLISATWRKSSISSYEMKWRLWSCWCSRWEVDPFQCSMNYVLDYLSESLIMIWLKGQLICPDLQYLYIMSDLKTSQLTNLH